MSKKILIDARMYGLEHAGIGRYLINLISELQKLNSSYEFVLLLRAKYFRSLNLNSNWKKQLADFDHYSVSEQLLLPNILRIYKPDLVHFPHFNIPLMWNGKFLVTIHDLTMHEQGTKATTLPLWLYYIKRIPYFLVFNKAITKSSKIIVPADTVKDGILKNYKVEKSKIKTIYEGFARFAESKNSENSVLNNYKIEKPYFMYIGNAYPHKNLGAAIKALKILNNEFNININFYIGGSRNVFTQRLISEIKIINMSKYVTHIGYVDENDLPTLYKNSVALVYPSLSEGFGLQGLEAIASGTTMICSDLGVFREIYKNHAYYFDPKNVQSITESMKTVVSLSEAERTKQIKTSKQFIERYSWHKMAVETLNLYNTLI